jgi:asparagine synthase (glutamine-hydrolysing)
LARGLHAIPKIPKALDDQQLVNFLADIPRAGPGTYYKDVLRVEPAHIVTLTRTGATASRYWELPTAEIRFKHEDDYADALREHLERATLARLRGAGLKAAAHLSSGLDSGAVATTAARIQAGIGGGLVAFTSAPRQGFAGPLPRGRIGDESGLAAIVAASAPGLEHVVLRSGSESPLNIIHRDAAFFQEPLGHPCNQVWVSNIYDEVQRRGLRVLLTGEAGNHTISAGGLLTLSEFVRSMRFGAWIRSAIGLKRAGSRWRGILASSLGPFLPLPVWQAITRITYGPSISNRAVTLLAAQHRVDAERRAAKGARGIQPDRDQRRKRWQLMQAADPGNFRKGVLAQWGVDERDPTSDRRLAEFCLALPAEQLIGEGATRRLARRAFADRLPKEVLYGPRGYQFADWYEAVDPRALIRDLVSLSRESRAEDFVDLPRLEELVSSFPAGGWETSAVMGTYRLAMLRAFSAAHFAVQA